MKLRTLGKKWILIWDDEWHCHYELKWFWHRNRGKENAIKGRTIDNLPPL